MDAPGLALTALLLFSPIPEGPASDEPARLAWSAWHAAEQSRTDAVPALVDLLRRETGPHEWDRELALDYVFDALVRLGAEVPAAVLAPWLSGPHEVPALILLLRGPEPPLHLLLETFRARHEPGLDPFLVAIGNVLARDPPPGFAAAVLARTRLRLEVTVVDEGEVASCTSSIGIGCADGVSMHPSEFPPPSATRSSMSGASCSAASAPGRS